VTSTTASVGSAADLPTGAERVDGRFELVALVKRGDGIDTYSGIDHLHGTDVVIKTVETATIPTAVYMRLGQHSLNIREFDLAVPTTLALKIYPEVSVELHLEARARPGAVSEPAR